MMDCLYAKCKSTVPSFLEWNSKKEQRFLVHEKKKQQQQHYSPSTLEAKGIENIDQDHCWLRQSTSSISLKELKNEKDG